MEIDYGKLIQMALETVIVVFLPVLLAYAVAWVNQQTRLLKAGETKATYEYTVGVVRDLVQAAEQIGLKQELLTIGADKKAWVMAQAEASLAQKGIHMDVSALSAVVEAQVYQAFTQLEAYADTFGEPAPEAGGEPSAG